MGSAKGRREHATRLAVPNSVRTSQGHQMRAQWSFQNLNRNHDEARADDEAFENGTFGGRWCTPVRLAPGSYSDEGSVEQLSCTAQSGTDVGEAAARTASRILFGISRE